MTEWQDIASAPKDGTVVDLWRKGRRHANQRWTASGNCFVDEWGNWLNDATHWMPLPAPPNQDKASS